MLFRKQIAVGAFLLSAALGGAEIVRERAIEQEERELMPFSYGQGFGYSSRSNRFISPRTRGREQGSAYLRSSGPYGDLFGAYNPPEEESSPSPSPSTKSSKNTKKGKGYKRYKAAKYEAPEEPDVTGRSYLGSMHWQRVPGQPLFVSTGKVPIIVLDNQVIPIFDENGEIILVDEGGNEIIIDIDEDGVPVLETSAPTVSPTEAPTDSETDTDAPTEAA